MALARRALTLLACCACLATLAAAENEPMPWVQLAVVEVHPSMVDEFVAVQREMSEYAKQAKVPWRTVSRTAVFGDTYRFLVATPAPNLASFDPSGEPDPKWTSLVNRVQRCITGRQSYAVRVMPEVGNPLPEDEEPDLMIVNFATIAPGREQEYMDIMNTDFLPHFKEAEVHHVTGSLAIGGEGGFVHVFYVKDFAELDQGSPAMRALSAEGAQAATAKLSGIVIKSELWVARVVADVSYGALPKESDEP